MPTEGAIRPNGVPAKAVCAKLARSAAHLSTSKRRGLVILIGAGVQQAALRIGESLLRLEYRLAQIEEDKPVKS